MQSRIQIAPKIAIACLAIITLELPVVGQQPAPGVPAGVPYPPPGAAAPRVVYPRPQPDFVEPLVDLHSLVGQGSAADPLAQQDLDLERRIQVALQQFSTQENERPRIRTELAGFLDKQFTLRQQRRENEISEIEQRARQLRDALKKRADARQTIVDRRAASLLSDVEGLGWGDIEGEQPGRVRVIPPNNRPPRSLSPDQFREEIESRAAANKEKLAKAYANAYARAMANSTEQPVPARDGELEYIVKDILNMFHAADSPEEAKKELRKVLDEQFGIRQEARLREIAEIEGRVRQLREALERRAAAKAQIIDRRLNDLLSEAEGLGWGESDGAAAVGMGAMGDVIQGRVRRPLATPAAAADPAADMAFARLDKDKDGTISEPEWKASFLDRSRFEQAGITLGNFPFSRDMFRLLYSRLPSTQPAPAGAPNGRGARRPDF